jgi:hypothetical protein
MKQILNVYRVTYGNSDAVAGRHVIYDPNSRKYFWIHQSYCSYGLGNDSCISNNTAFTEENKGGRITMRVGFIEVYYSYNYNNWKQLSEVRYMEGINEAYRNVN